MEYAVEFDQIVKKHLKKIEKSGKYKDLKKILSFSEEIRFHPRSGTGHPEHLRHKATETWSRKVNEKDRFVYEIYEERLIVIVKQVLVHYADR